MTKILPFTLGEQGEIRRLLRQADPARDIIPQDLARIERMTLAALASRPKSQSGAPVRRLWHDLFIDTPLRWPAAAFGAIAAGILLGNFLMAFSSIPAPSSLIAVAAAEPWQEYADDPQGDNQ